MNEWLITSTDLLTMLLINGCSYTYGDELASPEQERWSTHLARMRSIEVVNIAQPGSSNAKIFRDTINYIRVHQPSAVMVMWSAFERFEMYHMDKADWLQVSPSRLDGGEKYITKNKRAWSEFYALLVNRETMLLNTLNHMVMLEWICQELNIELVQGWFHENCYKEYCRLVDLAERNNHPVALEIKSLFNSLSDASLVGISHSISFNEFTDLNDFMRQPKGHPDAHAHEAYALYINSVCNARGYL